MSRSAGSRPTRRGVLFGALVSAASLAGVVWWAVRQDAPTLPSSGRELSLLILAILLYASNTLLRAERWQRLLMRQGARPARADTYALTAVGYAGNNLLPARLGDLFRIFWLAPRGGGSRRSITGTLLAERILDIVVLVALFAVVAYGVLRQTSLPAVDLAPLLAIAAGVGLVVVVLAAVTYRRGMLAGVKAILVPVGAPTLALRGRHGAAMIGITAAIWVQEAAVWGTAGAAAGLDMTPIEAIYLVSLASLFSLIPSGPGYVGTQDSAALLGAKAIGASNSVALSYLLVVRFVLIVPITIVGVVLLAVRYGGVEAVRAVGSRATRLAGPEP